MKRKITNALISVSDKSHLISILKILKKYKINIISSGGTFNYIKKSDLIVKKFQILNFRNVDGRLKLYILKFILEFFSIDQKS